MPDLRLLLVEDTDEDAILVLRELRKGGFNVTHKRVFTADEFQAAIDGDNWQLILADYSMPQFSGPDAFGLLQKRGLDIPFIIVSGTVGEETAVAAMKAGVHDFVLKDKLHRLVPAVQRELREASVRAEREKMREQLMLSDRLASVGMIASSVVHEINNPLASLISNLELLRRWIMENVVDATSDKELMEPLDDALEGSKRLRQVTDDLRLLSRTHEHKSGPVDIRKLLESSLRLAQNEIRHRAALRTNFQPVADVEGNEPRLSQVFLNLIVNAAQAIPEGRAGSNEVAIETRMDDRGRVVVEISDTGSGIPEDVLRRLFTPFMTTKPSGTGLGLAISRRLVNEAKGEIEVESEVGKGTRFRVILPAATSAVAPSQKQGVVVPEKKHRGTVLVVDDDPLIGKVVRRVLSAEHDVTLVSGAKDALQRIKDGARFDVILSDVMMPEITGFEMLARIEEMAADQARKIVFMTGGTFTRQSREALERVPNKKIDKPFENAALLALVNDVIG